MAGVSEFYVRYRHKWCVERRECQTRVLRTGRGNEFGVRWEAAYNRSNFESLAFDWLRLLLFDYGSRPNSRFGKESRLGQFWCAERKHGPGLFGQQRPYKLPERTSVSSNGGVSYGVAYLAFRRDARDSVNGRLLHQIPQSLFHPSLVLNRAIIASPAPACKDPPAQIF